MIDYEHISDAVWFFRSHDYKYTEVPWIVKPETTAITKPHWCKSFSTFMGDLVASGEQSFLEIKDTFGKNDKRICVTPCFRDEKVINDLTQNWFIKAELIVANPTMEDYIPDQLSEMIATVIKFLQRHTENITVAITNDDTENDHSKTDLLVNGIEVGSYGVRTHNGFKWIYGTACAEPRLSIALRNHNEYCAHQ